MKGLHLYDILTRIGGIIISNNKENFLINSVTIHAQRIKRNTLFFHKNNQKVIEGKRFDNLSFIAIVTDSPHKLSDIKENAIIIKVNNIGEAFNKFVEYYRQQFNIPIIGVTGTCGKTSTKELISWILEENKNKKIRKTIDSSNGLHMNLDYLLSIDEETEVGIFEMGVASPGDLTASCHYFEPTIGIITTIGTDHLKGCGTQDNYVKEKLKMIDGVKPDGTLILNKDNMYMNQIQFDTFKGNVIWFGMHENANFIAENIHYRNNGMVFTLRADSRTFDCYIPGVGKHNVYNALAAIAAVNVIGIPIPQAVERIKEFPMLNHRMKIEEGIKGSTVIDDTWSTNLTSVENALTTLKEIGQYKYRIAVLGNMTRMGVQSKDIHKKLVESVIKSNLNVLITVGEEAKIIANFTRKRTKKIKTITCKNTDEVVEKLVPLIKSNSIILLKVEYGYKPLIDKLIQSKQSS